jgi:N-acetylglucosamine-6-phosphate deacetylase
MLVLRNCSYLNSLGVFITGDIGVIEDTIVELGIIDIQESDEVIDISGLTVIPGLIDIHFHGALGYDIMEASQENMKKISSYLAKNGTTSFMATTITSTKETLLETLANINQIFKTSNNLNSSIVGVHIEGPYISSLKKGCHNAEWMRIPSLEEYADIRKAVGDVLSVHITLAPELDGALEFMKHAVKEGVTVSIGHSNADYKTTKSALNSGAVIFTHLYNAMRGIDHREPGVVGAALNSDSYVEIICDGIHVHPDIVNMTWRLKGSDKIVLVTDAMKAAGLGDGIYEFGGFKILVSDGIARKEDGTLASSTLSMLDAVKNMIKFTGITLEQAVQMATKNPAKAVGIFGQVGSIEVNKKADLVILNKDLNIVDVYRKGVRI